MEKMDVEGGDGMEKVKNWERTFEVCSTANIQLVDWHRGEKDEASLENSIGSLTLRRR